MSHSHPSSPMTPSSPKSPIAEMARQRSVETRDRAIIGDRICDVFSEFAVFDGRTHYLPRHQLMLALQALGLSPSQTALENTAPPKRQRVDLVAFAHCYTTLRPTASPRRRDVIRAFQMYDVQRNGWLAQEDFVKVVGHSARGVDAHEMLRHADPSSTGRADYVRYADFVCPEDMPDAKALSYPDSPKGRGGNTLGELPKSAHIAARERGVRKIMEQVYSFNFYSIAICILFGVVFFFFTNFPSSRC